jgi:two-component system, cell cycle response regulator DivK
MVGEPILIVDDNLANLKLARLLLEHEGYNVRTAADAEAALEILKTFQPQLILMDIQLPGMDGLELTRRLKSNSTTRQVTILAFYRLCDEERRRESRGGGVRWFYR